MQISNHGFNRSSSLRIDSGKSNKTKSNRKSGEPRTSALSGGDVAELTQQLRAQSEDRTDIVNAAKARLAAGDYLTPASAEATAESLLKTFGL